MHVEVIKELITSFGNWLLMKACQLVIVLGRAIWVWFCGEPRYWLLNWVTSAEKWTLLTLCSMTWRQCLRKFYEVFDLLHWVQQPQLYWWEYKSAKLVSTVVIKILEGNECLYCKSGRPSECQTLNVNWEYPIIKHPTLLRRLMKGPLSIKSSSLREA